MVGDTKVIEIKQDDDNLTSKRGIINVVFASSQDGLGQNIKQYSQIFSILEFFPVHIEFSKGAFSMTEYCGYSPYFDVVPEDGETPEYELTITTNAKRVITEIILKRFLKTVSRVHVGVEMSISMSKEEEGRLG